MASSVVGCLRQSTMNAARLVGLHHTMEKPGGGTGRHHHLFIAQGVGDEAFFESHSRAEVELSFPSECSLQ